MTAGESIRTITRTARRPGRPSLRGVGIVVERVLIYGLLIAMSVVFLLPFYWMITTALKPQSLIYEFPPDIVLGNLTLRHFSDGWQALPFGRIYLNTIFVTTFSVVGTVLSSSLAGYGFARYRAPGSNVLFITVLATMMVPPAVTMIPKFVMFSEIGWLDSYLPLIVPTYFGVPFFIFLFRQFFRMIPTEYFDAAELDGASPLSQFFRIAVPMARPAFVIAAVFATLIAWNDFQEPLVYLSSLEKFTLQLGLATFRGQFYTDLHLMMPMALLAMLPVLILVAVGQRWIVRSLTRDVEK